MLKILVSRRLPRKIDLAAGPVGALVQKTKLHRYRDILAERLVVASALTGGFDVRSPARSGVAVQDRHVLDDIQAALGRIESGSFGTCLACGEALSDQRLARRPAASRCEACARQGS